MDILKYNDGYIDIVATLFKLEDELKTSINKKRVDEFNDAYNKLRFIANGSNAKISYEIFNQIRNMGSITIIGEQIKISNIKYFVDAARLADNFHIWSNSDVICIEFAFYGLMK